MIEESTLIISIWLAGGDLGAGTRALYDNLIFTGLSFSESINLVQIYLRDANSIGGRIKANSPGYLVIRTASGIAALTMAEKFAVDLLKSTPLPSSSFPAPISSAVALPASSIGETQIYLDGGSSRQLYWDGDGNWRRLGTGSVVSTPAIIPGQTGQVPQIP